MNRELVDGLLRGLGNERVQAVLAPREGACCVELRPPELVHRGASLEPPGAPP